MSAENQYDVIIVGAGISGLSAGCAFNRRKNIKIACIEKKGIGSNNPSPLTFFDVIKEHNLLDCIKGGYLSFGFHNHKGSSIRFLFEDQRLVVLDYQKACIKLYNKIKTCHPDFSVINNEVIDVWNEEKGVCIKLKDEEVFHAKILIDCSGKEKLINRLFASEKSELYSHVYGAIFSGLEGFEDNSAYYLWPVKDFGTGGGWFYPLNEGRASFGYAAIADTPNIDYESLKEGFNNALQEFRPYNDYLRKGIIENVESGSIPVLYAERLVYPNILISGDAGGMATNWTCMGIEPSLQYGRLAGEFALKALIDGDSQIIQEYQTIWEKENKATYDSFAKLASTFWNADYNVWEWIIKNDLAYLTPDQMLRRMRKNDNIIKKHQILFRALHNKIKNLFNKKSTLPEQITIQ
ncbi:MAG: NAD(P)/FAD-dependent oxidoreductase [Desulfatiglans sp.]|nr:NAD(P)/FAD-dependent oxidoreductase [Desulfatiglans sp.]